MLEIIKEFFGTLFSLMALSWVFSKAVRGVLHIGVVTVSVFLLAKLIGI
jgi:hypothetical protein